MFNPVRRLVLEPQHRGLRRRFREYGGWLRPACYGDAEAVAREALRARETVGVFDGSPLGKIEVFGPQAGALVDFNSYNTISTLKPRRIRYGFMLTETGFVYDDGVAAKVDDHHYIVSCSSGHVRASPRGWRNGGRTASIPPGDDPQLDPAMGDADARPGRARRRSLSALDLGVDLDDASLPHMSFAHGVFEGRPARLARVSFTGDRSYEISVPSPSASELFAAMLAAAVRFGGGPLGSEALLLLRAEKGYLIAGKDTDGVTMPHDLGVSGPRDKRRSEYVGQRSLFTANALRADRRQFVGLSVDGGDAVADRRARYRAERRAARSIGFVTSSYFSPTLGRPIALGLIERGRARRRDRGASPSRQVAEGDDLRSLFPRSGRSPPECLTPCPIRWRNGRRRPTGARLIDAAGLARRGRRRVVSDLVTGDLSAAFAFQHPQPASVGLWEIARPAAAIRIGRDRALLVSSQELRVGLGMARRRLGRRRTRATPIAC